VERGREQKEEKNIKGKKQLIDPDDGDWDEADMEDM
jgi:hypothetical protein